MHAVIPRLFGYELGKFHASSKCPLFPGLQIIYAVNFYVVLRSLIQILAANMS